MMFVVNSIQLKNVCTITAIFLKLYIFFYLFRKRAIGISPPKNNLTSTVYASARSVCNIISLVKRYIADTKTIRCR